MFRHVCNLRKFARLSSSSSTLLPSSSSFSPGKSCLNKTAELTLVNSLPRHYSTHNLVMGADGFYILLPEIPPGTLCSKENNEILDTEKVPNLNDLTVQKCRDAIGWLSLQLESKVWNTETNLNSNDKSQVVIDNYPKYNAKENLLKDLDSKDLEYAIALVQISHILRNWSNYQQMMNRANKAINTKFSSKAIHLACKELLADDPQNPQLQHYVRMGRINGLESSAKEAKCIEEAADFLGTSLQKYIENVKKDTDGFHHLVLEEKHLGNMSLSDMEAIAKDKSNPKKGPWTVTLQPKVYDSFMENCPLAALRWNLWQARQTRCTREPATKNGALVEEIRRYRSIYAKNLGYRSFPEYALEDTMAGSPHNVKTMIATLIVKCLPQQKKELERLTAFAVQTGYDHKLNPWDIPYWRKLERDQLYNMQNVKFPYETTLRNLLTFTSQLFGLDYKILPNNNYLVKRNGEEIARFVIDPFRSTNKVAGTHVLSNHLFSTLIANFDAPTEGKDSMLSYNDVNMLYNGFGQLLHECFRRRNTNIKLATDFQVPGHFLTMWLGNSQFVEKYLELSGDQLSNFLKMRDHFKATDLCYELYLADLDLELHSFADHNDTIMKKIWKTYNVQEMDGNYHLYSDYLIFYACKYYGNTWSKMLAADCYSAFVESESKNMTVEGERFRTSFFESCGNSHPSEIFRSFRGRDPSVDALLWTLGLRQLNKPEK